MARFFKDVFAPYDPQIARQEYLDKLNLLSTNLADLEDRCLTTLEELETYSQIYQEHVEHRAHGTRKPTIPQRIHQTVSGYFTHRP